MNGLLFLALISMGSLFATTGLRQFFLEPLGDPGKIEAARKEIAMRRASLRA